MPVKKKYIKKTVGIKQSNKQNVNIRIDNRKTTTRRKSAPQQQPKHQPVIVHITQPFHNPLYNTPTYYNPVHEATKEKYPVKIKTAVGEVIPTQTDEVIETQTKVNTPTPVMAEEKQTLKMPTTPDTSQNVFTTPTTTTFQQALNTNSSHQEKEAQVNTGIQSKKEKAKLYYQVNRENILEKARFRRKKEKAFKASKTRFNVDDEDV